MVPGTSSRTTSEGAPRAGDHFVILTSCTSRKRRVPAPAEDLYLGEQHVRLMRGVRAARTAGHQVQVFIVSAHHGLEILLDFDQVEVNPAEWHVPTEQEGTR